MRDRPATALRPLHIEPGFTTAPDGSALIRMGETMVLCTVSATEGVPRFREGRGGWLTAEYAMAPGSTPVRSDRESSRGKVKGRTHEIQRLIGRSLRAALDLEALGEWTLNVDCEVLQADAGTRTASVTGGFVALVKAVEKLCDQGRLDASPIRHAVGAVSCGLVGGQVLVDLDYREDVGAAVDANFVLRAPGEWIEVQATAEDGSFPGSCLMEMMTHAEEGVRRIFRAQREVVGDAAELVGEWGIGK